MWAFILDFMVRETYASDYLLGHNQETIDNYLYLHILLKVSIDFRIFSIVGVSVQIINSYMVGVSPLPSIVRMTLRSVS